MTAEAEETIVPQVHRQKCVSNYRNEGFHNMPLNKGHTAFGVILA